MLAEDHHLQLTGGTAVGLVRAAVGFGFETIDLGFQAGHLHIQCASIGRGERRIEHGQQVTGVNRLPLTNVDAAND